jgi:PAS domain S-box-containing protein
MTQTVLKVLILEDNPYDAELNVKTLDKENWSVDSRISSDEKTFKSILSEFDPDIILSDYNLPVFNGMDALQIARDEKPLTPFIIVTGSLDEEIAADCIKQGAWDYVLKEHLGRLNPAVKNAIALRVERQQRKIAEVSLRESEEHFRALAQNSPDVIMRFDRNCRHLFVNEAIYEQLLIKPELFIGKKHREMGVFDPELCEFWEKNVLKVFETKKAEEVEFSIPAKNGTIFIEWRLFPEFNNKVEVITVLAVARDISYKKEAQDALRRNEERLQLALEGTSDGLWDWNLKTNQFYFSARYFTLLGYQPDDFSQDINIFKDLMHPDDAGNAFGYLNKAIKDRQESIEIEVRFRRKDGTYAWILSRGKVYCESGTGEPIRIVGTNVDISFRKRQEEIRQTIFDIGTEVVTTRNIQELFEKIQKILGRIIDTRNCYVALYDEKTNIITLPFHKDEKDRFLEFPAGKTLTAYVIRSGQAQLVSEERIRQLSDAGEIENFGAPSVSWLGVPLKINKKIIGVFTVQSYDRAIQYGEEDVKILEFVSDQIAIAIERKRDEANLIIAKERAEESDRLKSSFLSNMSHEIRTPMNAIVGFAELLSHNDIEENDRREFIAQINQGTETLLNLIDDIIDISKIEAGQIRINHSAFRLSSLLSELHLLFMKNIKRQNKEDLELAMDNNGFDPETNIVSDSFRIRQVFINLISNAIKFTDSGKVIFGIKNLGRNTISFYVRDTGIGIDSDKLQMIFERFRQGHESKTKFYGGTGLGLAISKNLVELMGGQISVNSQSGCGSEFIFSITFSPTEHNHEKTESTVLSKVPEWNNKTILIAEDEVSNYLMLSEALKPTGVRLIWAKDGREVVDLFRNHPEIDIVLMDIQLPYINGYDATRQIKQIRKEIPVIAQTAYAMAGEREMGLNAGCDDYVSKPVKHGDLFSLISKFLDKKA